MNTINITTPTERISATTLTQALEIAQQLRATTADHITIRIPDGSWHERITITTDNLTLEGSNSQTCIITAATGAFDPAPITAIRPIGATAADIEHGQAKAITTLGTFRTATVRIAANNCTLRNLTVANTAGDGSLAGQAIALYANGTHFLADACTFSAFQDTLFIGPLPESERQIGGFIGPDETCERINTTQHYRNCCIEGNVDMIFGSGHAIFEHCTIRSIACINGEPSFVTAASTPEHIPGFEFNNCMFVNSSTHPCKPNSIYLGRPWRDYAAVTLRQCYLDTHISDAGWQDWSGRGAQGTTRFMGVELSGPGAAHIQWPYWTQYVEAL